MAATANLPAASSPVLLASGAMDQNWYRYFKARDASTSTGTNTTTPSISAAVDIVTQDSIDATGATDVAAALQSAVDKTCAAGLVPYVKDGLYNLGSATLTVPALGHLMLGRNATLRRTADPKNPAPCVVLLDNSSLTGGIIDNSVTASSASSVSIGLGAKTFTVQSGLSFTPGAFLFIWAGPTSWMQGTVSSYLDTTLVMNITTSAGSGTFAAWTLAHTSTLNAAVLASGVSGASVAQTRVTSAGFKWAVGIEFDVATDCWAEDCKVEGVHNRCFYVYRACTNIDVIECIASGGGICQYGYNVNPAASGVATKIKFGFCDARNTAAQGFELGDQTYYSGFVGCTADVIGNTGFVIQTANSGIPQYNFMSGCVASNCGFYGAQFVSASYNSVSAFEAVACATGFYLNGTTQLCTITGLRVDGGGNGLRVGPNASRNDVVGMAAVANTGTGVLFDAGSTLNRVMGRSYANGTAVTDNGTSNTKDILTA